MTVAVLIPFGVEFTFLPDPVDMGFVGTGSAVGGVLAAFVAYVRGEQLQDIAETAANGALALGTVGLTVWISA